jgi:hypothetical protein
VALSEWPVSGAVIGYLRLRGRPAGAGLAAAKAGIASFMPEVALGLYPWTIVVDHVERRAALTSVDAFSEADAAALRARLARPRP